MEALVNSALGLAAKIAREFSDIPGLADMGYSGLDTLGLLQSGCVSGCGVSPQAVPEASRLRHSPPQVDAHKPVSNVWSFAATIDNALIRNPKARIQDAGKLLAAIPNSKL